MEQPGRPACSPVERKCVHLRALASFQSRRKHMGGEGGLQNLASKVQYLVRTMQHLVCTEQHLAAQAAPVMVTDQNNNHAGKATVA